MAVTNKKENAVEKTVTSAAGAKVTETKAAVKTEAVKAEAVKTKEAPKAAEVKAVETKTVETKTAEAEKPAPKKRGRKPKSETAAPKAAAKKTTAKKAAKAEPEMEIFIESLNNQINEKTLIAKVLKDCKDRKVKPEDIQLYVKPEENACYYVANNDKVHGQVVLFD